MKYLLDTNVFSEWAKPQPDPRVVAWLAQVEEDHLYMSVISLAEIRCGIELLPEGSRKKRLSVWLSDELAARFEDRILDVDQRIALLWGVVAARSKIAGTALSVRDGFLAATAEAHELTLVTRNTRDFKNTSVSLLDPWTAASVLER